MRINRRRFLGTAASSGTAGLLAACSGTRQDGPQAKQDGSPSIEDLDRAATHPILQLDGLTNPIIIDSIRLIRNEDEHFIHVRAEDGSEGISVTSSRAEYLYPLLSQISPFLIGKDARQWESELMFELYRYRSNYKLQGLAFWCVHAWVEFAILDMLGRIAGKSMGDLLGGVIRRKAAYYIASGRRDSTPEEEVEYLQSLLDETKASAVKFRVGGRMSRNADASPGRTENLIKLARQTLGDEIDIHADSNSSYDPQQAIKIGRMLEDISAVYFEEPCRFDHLEDTKKVTDALTIPVSGGEQEFSQRRFRWMIHNRGVDIVQPDLHYYGGLIRSIRVANMAALAKMSTTVHISGGFGFVYMLHFASCVDDIGKYQEYKRGIEKYNSWFAKPLDVSAGKMTVPEGPGVGIHDIAGLLKGGVEIA